MKRILLLAVLTACSNPTRPPTTTTTATDAVPPPTQKPTQPTQPQPTTVYKISRGGIELGTLRIAAGEIGVLESTATGDDADDLRTLWSGIAGGGPIYLDTESRSPDGSREYGTRVYRPTDDGYADAVRAFLQYEKNYDVETITR
jgi:hypothetical protein